MPKHLTADSILQSMKRATYVNALKLTDSESYDKIEYAEFFSKIKDLDLSKEQSAKLNGLQEEMRFLSITPNYREDKLYVFFIISLCEILSEVIR